MSEKVDNFSTNVLIIGKSGVGKSSLLNYIFDQQLAETGSGKPVTKEEIFKYSMTHPSGMTVYVFDTWGLEADKADRWTKLIMDEVKAHDCADICDWFHTILYCISAKSARIEEFERQQIKLLLDAGNRVIVCLTHCDARNIEQSISALTAELCAIGLTEKDIIQTVSVSKKLLGSTEAAPKRGRDEILLKIQSNLWETVAAKLPSQLTAYANKEIDEWYKFCCNGAKANINASNANSTDFKNLVLQNASDHLKKVINKIESEYRKRASEAMDYYKKLCSAISVDTEDFNTDFEITISFDEFYDYSDSMSEAVSNFFHALPGLGSFLTRLDIDDTYYKLAHQFEEQATKIKSELGRYFYSLSDKMKKRSPNNEKDERETKIIDKDISVETEIEFTNCHLDFRAMIYLTHGAKIIIRNCDIVVDPTTPAAIFGDDAEITITDCTLTYHGSNESESYFIYGDGLNITFLNTELNGCYCMYSSKSFYKKLSNCNNYGYTGPSYNVPKDFGSYRSAKNTALIFNNCHGKLDYTICVEGLDGGIDIYMKDSRFTHSGIEFGGNDYYIFDSKTAEIENCTFENFSSEKIFSVKSINKLKDSTFRNCMTAVYISSTTIKAENCVFEDCKGGIGSLRDGSIIVSECSFKNCCGKMIDGGALDMKNSKLDGGMPYILAAKSNIRDCEFINWSLRYAMARISEDPETFPIVFYSSAAVIENCLFADISLTDAGSSSSCSWSVPSYLIVGSSEVYDITIKNTEFRNVSAEKGIVRTSFQYRDEEEAFLPFLPPKQVIRQHYISLSVENCTGIDSYGKTN